MADEQIHDDLGEYMAQIAERDAEIDRLRSWKSAVPIDALRRCHYGSFNYPGWDVDQSDVILWIEALENGG